MILTNDMKKIIKTIYVDQVSRTNKKQLPKIQYTYEELCEWIKKDDTFIDMYNFWDSKGRVKKFKPSIDRLDDYKGYSFHNIRLLFWCLNNEKGSRDRVIGINNKQNKRIEQLNKDGIVIKCFHSLAQAGRETFSETGQISAVCKGKRKTHNGYKWRYKT